MIRVVWSHLIKQAACLCVSIKEKSGRNQGKSMPGVWLAQCLSTGARHEAKLTKTASRICSFSLIASTIPLEDMVSNDGITLCAALFHCQHLLFQNWLAPRIQADRLKVACSQALAWVCVGASVSRTWASLLSTRQATDECTYIAQGSAGTCCWGEG